MFGFDQHGFMSAGGDVLLHDTEVVEATQQETTAVHPQVKVHLLTRVPTHKH